MKVLIVDDEPLALDCVLSMIDWQAMGIAQVRTASNVRQAKELFLQDRADILLCDIEMPGDNGLELVEWIRRQNISAEVILLTAHVNFSYAKQAVDLGCLGYLLKPIDPAELKKGLKSAIQIVHQKQSYAHYRENSDRWMRNKPVMAELFWQKIADFTPPLLPEDIAALQEKYSTDYPQNTTVFPLLCRILVKDLPGVEEQIKNEISAALFPFCDEIIFLPSAGGALLALCIGRGRALTPQRFQQRAEEILGLCETMHGVKLSIYLDCICDLSSVPQAVIRLQEVSRNNIWGTRGVFTTETGVESSLNPPLPNLQLWSKLMLENDYQAFRIELERYREKLLYASKLGAAFLFQLHHDFLQTVYFVLYTKGIQIHQAFPDDHLLAQTPEELGTVDELFAWISAVAEHTQQTLQSTAGRTSPTDEVLQYVAQHLGEPLSREDLAQRLHVSPDHLTRIVKRATGLTLSEYIQQQRINLAKDLLCCTRQKISEIALSVGYPHFSQFSMVFKKHTGLTPQAYRAKYAKKLP